MATKLGLFNDALYILGQEPLASLSEDNVGRRSLDQFYDKTLTWCLERGAWNFAMRASSRDSSTDLDPSFGFSYAFSKPADWVRTYRVSSSETLDPPLIKFNDEGGVWYADCDPLYVKYVSSHVSYGGDLTLWPETYANFVAHRLAIRICKKVTGSDASEDLQRDMKRAFSEALSKDAMDESVSFPPQGTWATSRGAGLKRSRWNGLTY